MYSNLRIELHPKQTEVFTTKAQTVAMVAGRGWGKSHLLRAKTVSASLTYDTALYSDPTATKYSLLVMADQVSAVLLHWLPLVRMLDSTNIVESINHSDRTIRFKGNLPGLIVRGADRNGDRLRGLDLTHVSVDEGQNIPRLTDIWDTILLPALGRNKVWSGLVIGTPNGKGSNFYDFTHSKRVNRLYTGLTKDNPFIPRVEIERAERLLPPAIYRQEYLASWEDAAGLVFSGYAAQALPSSYDIYSTHLGVDWGETNPAAVVYHLVRANDKWLFIVADEYKNTSGQPVPEMTFMSIIAELCHKHKVFSTFMPDDRPSSIVTARAYGKTHDVPGMTKAFAVPRAKPGLAASVSALNSLFYQRSLLIADSCPYLTKEVTSLSYARNKQGNYTDIIDKASSPEHLVSALRYGVVYQCLTEAALKPLLMLTEDDL